MKHQKKNNILSEKALEKENLHSLCRTCLMDLDARHNVAGVPLKKYNVQTTENLFIWIQNLTAINVLNEYQSYPKYICQSCYEKFHIFTKFQKFVWKVSKKLDHILRSSHEKEQTFGLQPKEELSLACSCDIKPLVLNNCVHADQADAPNSELLNGPTVACSKLGNGLSPNSGKRVHVETIVRPEIGYLRSIEETREKSSATEGIPPWTRLNNCSHKENDRPASPLIDVEESESSTCTLRQEEGEEDLNKKKKRNYRKRKNGLIADANTSYTDADILKENNELPCELPNNSNDAAIFKVPVLPVRKRRMKKCGDPQEIPINANNRLRFWQKDPQAPILPPVESNDEVNGAIKEAERKRNATNWRVWNSLCNRALDSLIQECPSEIGTEDETSQTEELEIDRVEDLIKNLAISVETKSNEVDVTNSSKKGLKCYECDDYYESVELYSEHMRQHLGMSDNKHTCNICGLTFVKLKNLHRHVLRKHTQKPNLLGCDYALCNRKFRDQANLEKHYKRVHMRNKIAKKLRMQRQKSSKKYAGATNNNPSELPLENGHIEPALDTKPKIKLNGNALAQSNEMEDANTLPNGSRKGELSTAEVGSKCEICDRDMKSAQKLKIHYRNVHKETQRFPCPICSHLLTSKSYLHNHMMLMHNQSRPYPCHFCPYRFGTKNTRKIHERTHTGEKPFQCDVCERRFTQHTAMKNHRRLHDKYSSKELPRFARRKFRKVAENMKEAAVKAEVD